MWQIGRVLARCRNQCLGLQGVAVALVRRFPASRTGQCFPRPDRKLVVRQDRGGVASFFSFVVRLLTLCRDWGVSVTNLKGYALSYDGKSIMMLRAKDLTFLLNRRHGFGTRPR